MGLEKGSMYVFQESHMECLGLAQSRIQEKGEKASATGGQLFIQGCT